MKKHQSQGDPFERMREAQDHRYDPGHFMGGNIDPLLAAPRPNRYGWVLFIIGVAILVFVWTIPRDDAALWQILGTTAFALLYVFAGIKLLRRRRGAGASEKRS